MTTIQQASTPDDLVAAIAAAVSAGPPTRDDLAAADWWSTLVSAAVGRTVDIVGPPDGVRWRWFVTGSCGRGEGLPGADVETLAIYASDGGATRSEVLERAATVHALLERAGIPPDGNGAFASRARCCRTSADWESAIDRWAEAPQNDRGVVMAGLTLDSHPVGSLTDDLGDLATWMRAAAGRHSGLRRAMAQDCTSSHDVVPARLAVLTGRRDTVDLKRAVIDPIVRLARFRAMLADSPALLTTARLAVDENELGDIDWTALTYAYESVTALRWTARRRRQESPSESDVVSLGDLTPYERVVLRSAGREVQRAQRVLRYVWRLL